MNLEWTKKKEEWPVFDIKIECIRPIIFLIDGLVDYFGLECSPNPFDKIQALADKKLIRPEAANHLRNALNAALGLRMRCHLHYEQECDDAFHPSIERKEKTDKEKRFIFSEKEIQELISIYQVIFPLNRVLKKMVETGDFTRLIEQTFFDPGKEVQGLIFERFLNYDEAKKCFHAALALNPDHLQTQINLAHLLMTLGEFKEAKEYVDKALATATREKSEENMVRVFQLQGMLHDYLGDPKTAVVHYTQGLEYCRKMYGNKHPNTATCLFNLGSVFHDMDEQEKAVECYEQAFEIEMEGKRHAAAASALNGLGRAWLKLGQPTKAKKYFEEAVSLELKENDEHHPSIASTYNNLGLVYSQLDAYPKAAEYFEKSLKIKQKIYGTEHIHVAMPLNNLADLYRKMGKIPQAIELHQKALDIRRKVYGEKHPDIAMSLDNLGLSYTELGDFEKGCAYHQEALLMRLNLFGENHTSVATSYHNLGLGLQHSKQPEKAVECFEKALSMQRGDPAERASTLDCLGLVFQEKKDYNQALDYHREAFEIRRKKYGMTHSSIATSLNNIGLAYHHLGKVREAKQFYEEALEIEKRVHGPRHMNVARTMNNLGMVLVALDETNEGLGFCLNALKIVEENYGKQHPLVGGALANLGRIYEKQDRTDKALEFYEAALVILLNVYGSDHEEVLSLTIKMGELFHDLTRFDMAASYFKIALKIQRKKSNPLDLANVLNIFASSVQDWGVSMGDRRRIAEAIPLYEEALRIFENEKIQIQVGATLNNLGLAHKQTGNLKGALEYYEKSSEILKETLGEENAQIAINYINRAMIHKLLFDLKQAIFCFEKALQMNRRCFGDEHSAVATNLDLLGSAYDVAGNTQKAIDCFTEALRMTKKFHGPNTLSVAQILLKLGYAYNDIENSKETLRQAKACFDEGVSILLKLYKEEARKSELYQDLLSGSTHAQNRLEDLGGDDACVVC